MQNIFFDLRASAKARTTDTYYLDDSNKQAEYMGFVEQELGRSINSTYELARRQKALLQPPDRDDWTRAPDVMVVNFIGESAIRQAISEAEQELNHWS